MLEVLRRGPDRVRARRGVVLAAVTVALAAPAGAEAALSGPNPVFTQRPSLVTVTYNGRVATFSFDRPVATGPAFSPGAFQIGGYRAGVAAGGGQGVTAVVSLSEPKNVIVTFSAGGPDFNASTFGAIEAGAVVNRDGTRVPVLADSTPIRGATGQSGVRGHTAGPDLQSVALDVENNRMTYNFDQDVDAAALKAEQFRFADVSGRLAVGSSIVSVSGANVVVAFTGEDYVSTALQGIVLAGVLAVDGGRTPAPSVGTATVPGRNPTTGAPALLSVAQEAGSTNAFLFTFDRAIGFIPNPSGLQLVLSNSPTLSAISTVVLPPNTIRAVFPTNVGDVIEHVVAATVAGGAVTGTSTIGTLPGNRPFGGNAGALASGYTTAPDALSATVNRTTGQVTVLFDSRLVGFAAGNVTILGADGLQIIGGGPTASRVIQGAGPSQARLVLQFTPLQAQAIGALQINGNGVSGGRFSTTAGAATATGTIGGPDAQNIRTLLVPGATSSTF